MAMASAVIQQQPDAWYAALLGLAEHFRTSNPPNVKHCVHCLQAVFTFKPPPSIEARTHLQIGTVLANHTKNVDLALSHLDRAVGIFGLLLLLFLYLKEPNKFHIYGTEKITRKASDARRIYRVVRFFHPRSSCTTHLMLFSECLPMYVSPCMTILGERTEQHVIGFGELAAVD